MQPGVHRASWGRESSRTQKWVREHMEIGWLINRKYLRIPMSSYKQFKIKKRKRKQCCSPGIEENECCSVSVKWLFPLPCHITISQLYSHLLIPEDKRPAVHSSSFPNMMIASTDREHNALSTEETLHITKKKCLAHCTRVQGGSWLELFVIKK